MRRVLAGFLAFGLCVYILGCTPTDSPAGTSSTISQISSNTSNNTTSFAIGGDAGRWLTDKYQFKVNGIPSPFFDEAGSDVTQNWISNYESQKKAGTLDTTYPPLVKFIKDTGLSKEACLQAVQWIEQNYLPTDPDYLTVADMQAILTFDTKQINQRFVSAYAICVEGEIYTPHWILNHSAEDYKAAGITAAQIEEKLPTYAQFLGTEHQDYTQLYNQKLNDLKALEK